MAAHLLQLSVKPKTADEVGLPKRAVPRLVITTHGADGDYNEYRSTRLGGDPDQAILLVTEEILLALRGEGWPMAPGDFGENLTLGAVPEASLMPGTRLRVGTVELEVSKRCDPCSNLYHLPYVGRARGPEFLRTTTDRRGWYARVRVPGTVSMGDAVAVLMPAPPP